MRITGMKHTMLGGESDNKAESLKGADTLWIGITSSSDADTILIPLEETAFDVIEPLWPVSACLV